MSFDANSILAGLLVSSIGFVLLAYGKKMGRPPQLLVGLVLCAFPYFVSSALWILVISAALLGALWAALQYGL